MFNLGLPEMVVIGVAALLVFGPKRLPELAKGLGKGIRDFKKALDGGAEEEVADKTAAKSSTEIPPAPETIPGTEARQTVRPAAEPVTPS